MDLNDLIVEVRDKNLVRQGLILPEDLNLQATDLFNNVGTWKLDLPYEHPMTPFLRTPGAGLIITMPNDLVFSGPVVAPTVRTSQSDPKGTVTFEGVSDDVVLADYLAWPDPSNVDPTAQTVAYDVRTGNAEFLLHEYVNANLGPGAPVARQKSGLTLGTDLNRGTATKYAARFEKLGQVLANIAATAPGLGFRVVQRGNGLVFETYMAEDKSDVVRLDIYNRTTQSQEVAVSAPTATKVIIGGSGEATDRNFYLGTSTEADTAESDWGRRIERFVDQRQSDDATEYATTAGQILNDEGKTIVGAKMTPGDDTTMTFGSDWAPGDYIGIVFADGEAQAVVTGYSLIADQQGLRVGVLLGDVTQFDVNAAVAKQTSQLASRLDAIERNDATSGYDLSGLNQARIEAAEALAAADAAQTTADGKNTVYFQTGAPTGGTYLVDDLWYDTDNGYSLSRWSGSAWVAAPYGTGALGAGSVTASILAAGSVVAGKIAADAISANELQADSVTSAEIAAGAVVAGKIAALAVTAGTIAADAVTANEIAAGAVSTGELAAGAVTAAKISAGSITADKLSIGAYSSNNLLANGTFEDGNDAATFPAGWGTASGATWLSSGSRSGTRAVSLPSSGSIGVQSDKIVCAPGDVFSLSAWAKAATANANGFYLRVSWRNSSDVEVSTTDVAGNVAVGTSFAQSSGQATAPASTAYLRVQIYNTAANAVTVDDVDLRRVVQGVQIADGAISTAKLVATAIDGMTITGALFRTAASGQRIEMSGSSGDRIKFFTGNGSEVSNGALQVLSGGDLYLFPPAMTSSGAQPPLIDMINYGPGAAFMQLLGEKVTIAPFGTLELKGPTAIRVFNTMTLDKGSYSTASPLLAFRASVFSTDTYTWYADNAGTSPGTSRVWLDGPDLGECHIGPRAGADTFNWFRVRADKMSFTLTTTSTTAQTPLHLNTSSDVVFGFTSSERFKDLIEELNEPKWDLLNVNPWLYKGTADGDTNFGAEPARDVWGLVAEDLDQVGLHELVVYAEDGTPWGIDNDRIPHLMIPMIRDLKQRIETLEASTGATP